MRVITGTAGGRRLREPEGQDTRPTTDRVKEGLFSAIQFEIEGRTVLDLFAGTGQLGIECLSRGAAHCVFVDKAPRALELVRENLRRCGLHDRAAVVSAGAVEWLERTGERFDLVFLDPPYESGLIETALKTIREFDILKPHGIIAAEHPADVTPEAAQWRVRKRYRYGKIAVTLYVHGPGAGNEDEAT